MAVAGFFSPSQMSGAVPFDLDAISRPGADRATVVDTDRLVVALFQQEGQSLVRLALRKAAK